MLLEQARSFGRVYLFVDALDRIERRLAFGLLEALDDIRGGTENVSIMVSSPEILEYHRRLSLAREHEVCANDEEVSQFVRRRIAKSAPSMMYKMVQQDKNFESEIQETLKKRSDGMYVLQFFHACTS